MTPEELARIRTEKLDRERKENEERERATDAKMAAALADQAASRAAIASTILPYLHKVSTAMNGALVVTASRDNEKQIVLVQLELDGRAARIQSTGSSLGFSIQDVAHRTNFMPYDGIRSAADVSEESLGRFVQALMESSQ
jgi:hypothetical protein